MSALQDAAFHFDDDVILLDANDLETRPAKRRNRRILHCLLLTTVSFTDSQGEVVVVDLVSDDDEPKEENVIDPIEPEVPPFCRPC